MICSEFDDGSERYVAVIRVVIDNRYYLMCRQQPLVGKRRIHWHLLFNVLNLYLFYLHNYVTYFTM